MDIRLAGGLETLGERVCLLSKTLGRLSEISAGEQHGQSLKNQFLNECTVKLTFGGKVAGCLMSLNTCIGLHNHDHNQDTEFHPLSWPG